MQKKQAPRSHGLWWLLAFATILWSIGSVACGERKAPTPDTKFLWEAPSDTRDANAPVDTTGQDDATTQDDTTGQDTPGADTTPDKKKTSKDPFAPLPDTSEGLTNTSSDLKKLMEEGALAGACKAYEADPTNRKKMLLCGKWMYFYEAFGTVGVPKLLPSLLLKHFSKEVGPGFSKYGMVADPYAKDGMPLGLADSVKLGGQIETVAFTCASCHFGQLPDGRYSVGAPNHKYEYGKQILALSVFPMVATGIRDKKELAPEVLAALQPLIDRVTKEPSIKDAILKGLLPMVGNPQAKIPEFTKQSQIHYATWPSGTMDFLIDPLPVDDKIHTVSKIGALWNIPTPDQRKKAGMYHAMLSWTGGTVSLMRFLEGFVEFGKGDVKAWTKEKLAPLAAYIHSLRAPKNPKMPDATQITKGKSLFVEKGCIGCHDGPGGSGKKLYDYEEIGTDPGMKKWLDPDLDGKPCCDLPLKADEPLTHKLKSPRLVGLWAMSRFLHNGSVPSLEALFCLEGPRPVHKGHGLGSAGHDYTCKELSKQEKEALIAYLKAQ